MKYLNSLVKDRWDFYNSFYQVYWFYKYFFLKLVIKLLKYIDINNHIIELGDNE